jgi:hypothetical protein
MTSSCNFFLAVCYRPGQDSSGGGKTASAEEVLNVLGITVSLESRPDTYADVYVWHGWGCPIWVMTGGLKPEDPLQQRVFGIF